MKINLVNPHQLPFPPIRGGGVENLNWLLAQEFARRGHRVTAYSRSVPELAGQEADAHGISHVRVKGYDRHPNRWIDHFNGLRYARNVASVLKPADITLFHTPFSFLLCRKRGLGLSTHSIHRTPKWPVPLYRGLDRVYCASDAVVAQARAIDPKIDNLKRIYNCVALPETPPASHAVMKGLLFLYVGRFVPDKGLASLIEGFNLAIKEFPENRLKTVGPLRNNEGANESFLNEMSGYVSTTELGSRIEFLPPIFDKSKLNELMTSADVICVPSLTGETLSMAVLEAMALAKPVLVSDFKPMTEAVDHMTTGYVAKAGNSQSMAEGIRFFSGNSSRLVDLGRAGFAKAKNSFSVEKIAGEYLADFEALLEQRTAHGARLPSVHTL